MDGAFERSERYTARPVTFLGVRECPSGCRLKTYAIVYGRAPLDCELYESCLVAAAAELPTPAESRRSPGVGLAIFHQGRGVHYLVLGWWYNENELPLRVFVRPFGESAWRPARDTESVCVWDLEVLWHERQSYVRHVLTPEQGPDIEAYLADHLAHPTAPPGS